MQAWDGVFGGILIHGPATADYDYDLGNLFLTDWDHLTASAMYDFVQYTGPPFQDSGLINGKSFKVKQFCLNFRKGVIVDASRWLTYFSLQAQI